MKCLLAFAHIAIYIIRLNQTFKHTVHNRNSTGPAAICISPLSGCGVRGGHATWRGYWRGCGRDLGVTAGARPPKGLLGQQTRGGEWRRAWSQRPTRWAEGRRGGRVSAVVALVVNAQNTKDSSCRLCRLACRRPGGRVRIAARLTVASRGTQLLPSRQAAVAAAATSPLTSSAASPLSSLHKDGTGNLCRTEVALCNKAWAGTRAQGVLRLAHVLLRR